MSDAANPEHREPRKYDVRKALDLAFELRRRVAPRLTYTVNGPNNQVLHYSTGDRDDALVQAADEIVKLVAALAGRDVVQRYGDDMLKLSES